jgi:serine/threonine-protein kinase
MARDPAARYASAEAMAAELRRWASRHAEPATQTLSAAAAKTEPRAPHRGGLLVGGLLVVACGIAAGLAVRRPAAEPYAGTSAGRSATAAPLETPLTTSLTTPLTTPLAPGPASGDRPASSARPLSDNPAAAPRPQPARARTGAAVAARDTRLALAPESLPSGTLQLAITPWGEVEVDGQAAGTTPPLTRLSLPEGRHTITVRNDDAPPYSTTVQVSADKPVTVRYRFGP